MQSLDCAGDAGPPFLDADVEVPSGRLRLRGRLTVPLDAVGVVVIVDGTGSGRLSPRNLRAAEVLHNAGLGTLVVELLTTTEERDRVHLFDAERQAYRLIDVTDWMQERPDTNGWRLGYFGSGHGAPTVLWAAADPRVDVAAVVCLGERPDLAAPRLGWVRAPTLLIVGSRDDAIVGCNRRARARLHCDSQLAIVAGATHLFSEPGSFEAASDLAAAWFVDHMTDVSGGA
jgi:putative phosphoribosyl transferase